MTSIPGFKTARKAAAGLLLAIGVPLMLVSGANLFDPSAGVRELALVILAFVGLPPTATAGWLLWGLWEQDRQDKIQQEQGRVHRLQSDFFHLLEENEGTITPLQFAMKAQLSGSEAKAYLDGKAKEFEAEFEISDGGSVVYRFDLTQKQLSS